MTPRPAPSNPYLWQNWRAKFLRALLLGADSQPGALQAERAINLLQSLSERVGGSAAEIATISAEQVPLPAREVALERLADQLVSAWKVHAQEVRVALRQRADEEGCSVPTVKRQALQAAAWGVINRDMELPQQGSRLAPDWLVDDAGRRIEAPPAAWTVWELERWVIATTIRNAEDSLLASASADAYGEPNDDHVLLSDASDDPDIELFERRRELIEDLASPGEYELVVAMLAVMEQQDGRSRVHGSLAAAARALGITEDAAHKRFSRLCAKMSGFR